MIITIVNFLMSFAIGLILGWYLTIKYVNKHYDIKERKVEIIENDQ